MLNYIFEAVNHRNIGTVGYYVGGMKESALKLTESKQIVLATFSMASEGLDIKSLSTLFMVTPMTKIEQAVGRILRQKHDFNPVVVDIIDIHANFQNQWKKRKLFYKKQNYKIIQTNSFNYVSDTSDWKVIYNPTKTKNVAIKMETTLAFKRTKNDTNNNGIKNNDVNEDVAESIANEQVNEINNNIVSVNNTDNNVVENNNVTSIDNSIFLN